MNNVTDKYADMCYLPQGNPTEVEVIHQVFGSSELLKIDSTRLRESL